MKDIESGIMDTVLLQKIKENKNLKLKLMEEIKKMENLNNKNDNLIGNIEKQV